MARSGLIMLLVVLLAFLAQAPALGSSPSQVITPGIRLAFDFAPDARGGLVVLEDVAGRVARFERPDRAAPLGGLVRPRVLATDESGVLLVLQGEAESGWHVVAFQDGREVWSAALEGDVLPVAPAGADARDGTLWVVDKAPPRLLLFAFDGASLGWVDLSKWARSPFSIALGPSGEAFVSDPLGPAVLAFSPSASFVGTLDLTGTGVTRPTGLAVGPEGRLWVSDGVTGRVTCIDTSAQEPGQRCVGHPARFHDPLRLSWWDGALWILEGLPGRVQRLEGW